MIVGFNPRSTSLIAQPEVHGQRVRYAPIVLYKSRQQPVSLMETAAQRTAANGVRQSQSKARSRVSTDQTVPCFRGVIVC